METAATPTKEDAIRARVLQAAQQLFQQHGLRKVTMDDIARAMGKGKSSLYYYYKSKEEIFEAALDREMDEVLTQVAQAVEQAPRVEDKLIAFCLTRFSSLRKKVSLNSIVAGEVLRDVDFIYAIRRRYRQRESDLLKQIFSLSTTPSGLSGLPPQELEAVIFVLLSSLQGLELELLLTTNDTLLEPAIRILSRALVRGLA